MEYPDNELNYYLSENLDETTDIIYSKYKYIVDVLISKYRRVFIALGVDIEEARQEANLAFSDAVNSYNSNKSASLSTFITLCVERKIRNFIKKNESSKRKILNESISFEQYIYGDEDKTLESLIGDNTYEPYRTVENRDLLEYINKNVNNILSDSEVEVYFLLLNGYDYLEISSKLNKSAKQIDNTIQRIRSKLRKFIVQE